MTPSGELETDRTGNLDETLARQLAARMADEQSVSRLPSLAVGLVRNGALFWRGALGSTGLDRFERPIANTQYRIGSISKTFAAVEVMRLRDEGVLELNDDIGGHLEELAELPITIAQLLSHTSGLHAETAGPWWERTEGVGFDDLVASSLRPADLLCRPGRRFHYSNTGYAVLGELISRKRSKPFAKVLHDELLEPLGMDRTTLRPVAPFAQGLAVHPDADVVLSEPEHDAVAMAPAGQLWSTIDDLARWSEVLTGRCPEIVDPDTVAEMTEPIGLVEVPGQPWTAAHGLGLQLWNLGGSHRYGHSGSMPGFVAMLIIDGETKDAIIALTNSTSGFRPVFCDDLFVIVSSQTPMSPPAFDLAPVAPGQGALDLVGVWYWGPRTYRVSLRADGHLELRGVPYGRDASFRPNLDGTYSGEWGYFAGESLQARRRADGSVSHIDIASFVFTRTPYDPRADIPGGLDDKGWHTP
ncbi:MAG: serine hydrolase domain-containing protein [Acidimicrobiales bacterium]|jgi:CubicO group peptidase (beta-lactamase class C family)